MEPRTADERIGAWLEKLASAAPAPGGGAVAALETSAAAALVEMVCNLTAGRPAHAAHEDEIVAVRERATRIRSAALDLALRLKKEAP